MAKRTKAKHPTQPLVMVDGVERFKENAIVRFLLNCCKIGRRTDLNDLAAMPFSNEDRLQFAQLLGYSLLGFGDLSEVSDKDYSRAEKEGRA